MNSLIKKTSNRSDCIELISDGQNVSDPQKVGNLLNEHFASVGKKIQALIPDSNIDPLKYVKRVEENLLLGNINETKVVTYVEKLKNKFSSGIDGISNNLLKCIIHSIKVPFCLVLNKSLNSGVFPRKMKIARVRALYKSDNKFLKDNYRPISLLPVMSKILEKYVYLKLVSHMDRNQVLFPKQFGFRVGYSTNDAFLLLVAEILNSFNEGFSLFLVFIDLRKAFDTVDHIRLLLKLEQLGIRDVTLNWFRNYLTDRKQCVANEGFTSELQSVNVGIPQGSLLGVILFQLNINDIKGSLRFTNMILYADDTTMYVYGRNLKVLKCKMQADLQSLSMWLNMNKLLLNVKKTKSLLFSRHGNVRLDVSVNGEVIECVRCFKFLGFHLDSALTFEHHLFYLYNKLLKSVFITRKLSTFVPQSCLRSLYYAHFFSLMNYGINIWFPLLDNSDRMRLTMLQKRIVQIINNKGPRVHCMPLFCNMNLLTVKDLVTLENLKLMFKVNNGLTSKPIASLFCNTHHQYHTRTGGLQIPRHTLSKFNTSFLVRAIVDWNACDLTLHSCCNNVKLFASKMKASVYYNTIHY